MAEPSCGNCVYFKAAHIGAAEGRCRKEPPRFLWPAAPVGPLADPSATVRAAWQQPPVAADGWCGEHVPADRKEQA